MENIKEKTKEKVMDWITRNAGGRLIAFMPENSPRDLIVEKKGDYEKKVVTFNVYNGDFFDDKSVEKEVLNSVVNKDLVVETNFYLLFAHFDFIKQNISDDVWVIPSLDLHKLVDKKDFSKFLINKNNLSDFLINILGKSQKSDHSKDFLKKNIL